MIEPVTIRANAARIGRMEPFLARLTAVLRLTRLTAAIAAVASVWFVILWTRAEPAEQAAAGSTYRESPLWIILLGGTAYAVGLFSFATALNDTLDVRRDRTLHPDRPLPSGRMSVEAAAALVALTLLIAAAGAAVIGLPAVLMCLLTSGVALFYNLMARYLPSVGLVVLGLLYGSHMMTPNPYLVFVWPVLLVMAHVLALGAVTHLLARKRPVLTPQMLGLAATGWLFWSGVLLYVGWRRAGTLWPEWVSPIAAVGPGLLAAGFAVFVWNKVRVTADPARAAEKIRRYGSLWVALYATAWMVGQGLLIEAGLLAGLAAIGVLGLTVLREVYGLVEQPIGFRR